MGIRYSCGDVPIDDAPGELCDNLGVEITDMSKVNLPKVLELLSPNPHLTTLFLDRVNGLDKDSGQALAEVLRASPKIASLRITSPVLHVVDRTSLASYRPVLRVLRNKPAGVKVIIHCPPGVRFSKEFEHFRKRNLNDLEFLEFRGGHYNVDRVRLDPEWYVAWLDDKNPTDLRHGCGGSFS